ncbi:hypothetical protein, partial [Xanthomonas maliensis]
MSPQAQRFLDATNGRRCPRRRFGSAFDKRMKISIAALIALALLAACGKNTAPVDPKQNKPPLRPHCIGRVTIGLPAEATLQWTQTADLFAIARDQSPDRKAFDDEIELRKAQLAS